MSQPKESLINILKEKYEYENERKRYFDNIITLPVSLLAFIVAGLYVILTDEKSLKFFSNGWYWLMYFILVTTVISMIFLFRVLFGLKRKYNSFPDTSTVINDYENIVAYYAASPRNEETEKKIKEDFDGFVVEWYRKINDNNIKVNDTRMNNFHSAKIFIGISYLLGILVFGLYCNSKLSYKPDKKMAKQQTVQTPPPQQNPKPQPSPVRQEKGDKKPPLTK